MLSTGSKVYRTNQFYKEQPCSLTGDKRSNSQWAIRRASDLNLKFEISNLKYARQRAGAVAQLVER
jgi:hypothetical protein